MSMERWPVPISWFWATASEVAQLVGGGTPSSKDPANFQDSGIPWITPADLTGYDKVYISRGRRDLSVKGYNSSGAQLIPAGAVLFSSRAPIGYCAIAENEISTNQGFKSLVLSDGIVPEYIRYYLLSAKDYAESIASGTTFKELSGSRMANLLIPIAPINEQRRIVAKLDSLFARTRRAREELARIPTLIKHYKEAVLAAAFRGELTSGDAGQWQTVRLNDLILGIDAGKNIRCEERPPRVNELGIVKVSSVSWGEFNPFAAKTVISKVVLPKKDIICSGDFLISRANTIELVGACVIVGEDIPTNLYLSDKVLRIRFVDNVDKWVLWFLRSIYGRKQIENLASGNQLSMRNISQAAIRSIKIPLPPSEERNTILCHLDKLFSSVHNVAVEEAKALDLFNHLELTVLTKAFRGELVPQDPNDEPASALLERIRAARSQKTDSPRVRWRGKQAELDL